MAFKFHCVNYYIVILLTIISGLINSYATREVLMKNDVEIQGINEPRQMAEDSHDSYRLPDEVLPISYDLWLDTKLGEFENGRPDFSYRGKVRITVNVLKARNSVIVHNDDLMIDENKTALYRRKGNAIESMPIKGQEYDRKKQFYIVNFKKLLVPGIYELLLHFAGEVRDDVFGFYRSSYRIDDETKWMGVTQFSPTYARRAFPCMDEPYLKAVFKLHIVHNQNQTVTSNTEIESVTLDPTNKNYCTTTFLPTPRMSTYIVGWTVHNFVSYTNSSDDFKMWSRPSMHLRGSISLEYGRRIYSALRNWFLVGNPILKMDHVAVPDFNFNAMENWGMITFRESVVLYENKSTPTRNMINGLTTMAHEYGHTWFGNLVTPRFWDVAWLKEGFASYFQYFAFELIQPDWRMMDIFVVDTLQPTLREDSADHNRTMNGRGVGSPSSIMSTLDFVSYRKGLPKSSTAFSNLWRDIFDLILGASIVRMIRHIIGELAFRDGLQSYLRNKSYEAAVPFDVYKHLQLASDKFDQSERNLSIKDILETWTNQPGYPLISITRNYRTQSLIVSQERFNNNYDDFPAESGNPSNSSWWIPLNFATKSNVGDFSDTKPKAWLKSQEKSIILSPFNSEDWVIFNVQQVGYYRVNYDENNWRIITDYLRSGDFTKIHSLNRAALIDDAFNLARAGYIDYSIPFNISKYLIRETEYEPWVAAANNILILNNILHYEPAVHEAFQEFVRDLLEPMYKNLSFTEDPSEGVRRKLHRDLILSASCSINNAHCSKTSKALFDSWISADDKTVMQDVKRLVYCVGIRFGNEKEWYRIWDKFLSTDLHAEQELLLHGLGCTRSSKLIDKYLNSSISLNHGIRKQYRIAIINSVLNGNPENVNVALEFVRKNLQQIIDLRGHNFLSKIITAIGNKMATYAQVEKLQRFVDEKNANLGTAMDAAKGAVISARKNADWVKKYANSIAKCLI